MDKRAHCLNCGVSNEAWIYCKHLDEMEDNFDYTGETMACINYKHSLPPIGTYPFRKDLEEA